MLARAGFCFERALIRLKVKSQVVRVLCVLPRDCARTCKADHRPGGGVVRHQLSNRSVFKSPNERKEAMMCTNSLSPAAHVAGYNDR